MSAEICDHRTFSVNSPIGEFVIDVCASGLHSVSIPNPSLVGTFRASAGEKVCTVSNEGPESVNRTTKIQMHVEGVVYFLNTYFTDPQNIRLCSPPPMCSKAIPDKVSNIMHVLKYTTGSGHTTTCADLAKAANCSAKSVSVAVQKNPIIIFYPCHRVLQKNGKMGKCVCNPSLKLWLLRHEGVLITDQILSSIGASGSRKSERHTSVFQRHEKSASQGRASEESTPKEHSSEESTSQEHMPEESTSQDHMPEGSISQGQKSEKRVFQGKGEHLNNSFHEKRDLKKVRLENVGLENGGPGKVQVEEKGMEKIFLENRCKGDNRVNQE